MTDKQSKIIEQLYLAMYDKLYHYAKLFLKTSTLAEEAVQETFKIACSKPDDLLDSPNPRGWIVNTLKNVIRNVQKRQVRMSSLIMILGLQAGPEMAGKPDDVDLKILYGKLSETEDFKLVQEQADGQSIREIAGKRGISENACKKRIERAKKSLRKKIAK